MRRSTPANAVGSARRSAPRSSQPADERGLLVRLMGGMAIRAHAPEWPARTRRVEVDLDFATRSRDRGAFYELLAAEGYTPDKRHNALFGGKQALLRRRPAQPAGRRPGRQARDVPPARVRRPAGAVEPDPAAGRAPPVEAPGRQDQPQGRPRRAGAARRAPARPGRRRGRHAARARRDQRPADPGLHLERLGLVADRHRQPRHARPVPRDRAHARGPRPEQRPGRSGSTRRTQIAALRARHRRRAEVDASGGSAPGSASARSGTRSPKRWGTD